MRIFSAGDTVANFSPEHSGTEKGQRGYPSCLKSEIFIFIMKSFDTWKKFTWKNIWWPAGRGVSDGSRGARKLRLVSFDSAHQA